MKERGPGGQSGNGSWVLRGQLNILNGWLFGLVNPEPRHQRIANCGTCPTDHTTTPQNTHSTQ